jgi:DNA polymerase-3 subunit delta'
MNGDKSAGIEPRRNPDFIGHDRAEATVLRGWASGRMHHAWLISGPRGVGKATLAYRVARMALAGAGGPDLFGGVGPSLQFAVDSLVFRQVASGGHPDLLTVERCIDEKRDRRRSEIVVEDVREIGEFLHLKPAMGGWRVVIVDSADEMNRNAANALLKVLEEPPSRALLLIISHSPGRLLPTIRSRCRRLALGPLPAADVAALIGRLRPDMTGSDRDLLTGLAAGSIGRALEIAAADGVDLYKDIAGQLNRLPKLDAGELHGLADQVSAGGADGPFRLSTELLLDIMARAIRAGATGIAEGEGVASGLSRQIGSANLDQWLDLWEKISRLFARTEAVNLDRKQVWVGAMLEIGGMAGR